MVKYHELRAGACWVNDKNKYEQNMVYSLSCDYRIMQLGKVLIWQISRHSFWLTSISRSYSFYKYTITFIQQILEFYIYTGNRFFDDDVINISFRTKKDILKGLPFLCQYFVAYLNSNYDNVIKNILRLLEINVQ